MWFCEVSPDDTSSVDSILTEWQRNTPQSENVDGRKTTMEVNGASEISTDVDGRGSSNVVASDKQTVLIMKNVSARGR